MLMFLLLKIMAVADTAGPCFPIFPSVRCNHKMNSDQWNGCRSNVCSSRPGPQKPPYTPPCPLLLLLVDTGEAKAEDGGVMRWKELGPESPLGGELRGDLEHPH